MRNIKFRGKNSKGEWVYGGISPNKELIVTFKFGMDLTRVDPDTVGQFTGGYDCDGKEVYDGDIVRIADNPSLILRVAWGDFKYRLLRPDGMFSTEPCDSFYAECWRVIGNVHDNPELLEGDKING